MFFFKKNKYILFCFVSYSWRNTNHNNLRIAAVMGFITGPDMENTSINAGTLKRGRSSPGGAYDSPVGWPCRGDFSLVEVEVYCNGNVVPR
jgi:hypothetical protein